MSGQHHLTPADEEMISDMFSGYDSEELNAAMEAEQDVLGTRTTTFVEQKDASVVAKALEGMQEAIDAISQKDAYEEALDRAPRVVDIETPMERFLLGCGYNFWAAAERLVNYWKERKEIYGPDRFCFPLTISSQESALTADVVEMIHSGSVALPPLDRYGRGVILTDFQHVTDAYRMNTNNLRVKLYFYMTHILSESDLAIVNGSVKLVIVGTEQGKHVVQDGKVARFAQSTSLLAKNKASHIVTCRKTSFAEKNLSSFQTFLERHANLSIRARFHFLDTNDRVLETLEQYGLSKHHLPSRLGGSLDYHGLWQQRLKVEACRYLRPSVTENTAAMGAQSEKTDTAVEKQKSDDQHRKEEKKMENFKVWAKDHLQKCKVSQLQSEVKKIKSDQTLLHHRHKFLNAQLAYAEYIVQRYEQQIQVVYRCLSSVLASVPGVSFKIRDAAPDQLLALSKGYFDGRLLFLGRAPILGEWLFEAKPGLSQDEQHFAFELKRILQEQLQKLKDEDTKTSHEDTTPDGSFIDDDLQQVQAQVEKLRAQKEAIQHEQVFLSSALTIAQQVSVSYSELRNQNLGLLAEYYTLLLESHISQLQMDMHQFADLVVKLADYVLSQYTAFNGEYIVNPFVSMVRDRNLILSDSLRSHALWVVEPILSRIAGRPFAIHQRAASGGALPLSPMVAALQDRVRPREEADPEELRKQEERKRLHRLERKKRLRRL